MIIKSVMVYSHLSSTFSPTPSAFPTAKFRTTILIAIACLLAIATVLKQYDLSHFTISNSFKSELFSSTAPHSTSIGGLTDDEETVPFSTDNEIPSDGSLIGAEAFTSSSLLPLQDQPYNETTYTTIYFTTPLGNGLKVDITTPTFRPEKGKKSPIVICLFGGGFTRGSRQDMPQLFRNTVYQPSSYIRVAPDYRLLFPSTAFDFSEDMKALLEYLSTPTFASSLPSSVIPDPHSIGLVSISSGGYQLKLAGIHATIEGTRKPEPRYTVKAMISMSGAGGDLLSDDLLVGRFSEEGEARYHELIPILPPQVTKEQTWRDVQKNLLLEKNKKEDEAFDDPLDEALADWKPDRLPIAGYLIGYGILVDAILGTDGISEKMRSLPHEERESAVPQELVSIIPQVWIQQKHNKEIVKLHHPPIFLAHGEDDEWIPHGESVHYSEILVTAGMSVDKAVLYLVPGGKHNLENTEHIWVALKWMDRKLL